jgi:hypothetical protein
MGVEEVFCVAWKGRNFIIFLIIYHANYTFCVSIFTWLEFLFHNIFENIGTCWLPVGRRVSCIPVSPYNLRSEADKNCCDCTTFAKCDESKDDKETHYPVDIGASLLKLYTTFGVVWPEHSITIYEPSRVNDVEEAVEDQVLGALSIGSC